MAWTNRHTQLNDVLGDLIPNKTGILKFVRLSGLKPQFINTDGNALDVWNNVISEADKNGKVDNLIKAVLDMYPDNPFLKSALSASEINYSLSPDIDKISNWQKVSDETLEKLTMGSSTILPVNFLALGVIRSKAVAKVEISTGTNRYDVGTGFIAKVDNYNDLFFITNYHVINDKSKIGSTRIIFDYELDIEGNSKASKSFRIDENGPWYTSPIDECDVSIFKLVASPDDLQEYKYLELKRREVSKSEFVNIIHHPGGEMKQISLYHNIVTNTNDRIVQYLTDTLQGSSGSPVFNSNWEVIALHHSGGQRKSDEPVLPIGVKYRNEGIRINKIIDFLINKHKK